MAVSLTTVTGSIEYPSGATPARAVVRFRLTGADKNGGNVFMGVSEFPVASNGSFTAAVQHTDGMSERTFYEVIASYFDAAAGRQVDQLLGYVKVPQSSENVTLSGILPVQVPSSASSVHRVKRGDTISFGIVMLDQYGRPLDLTGYSISAAMRQGEGLRQNFQVTRVSNPNGRFDLTLPAGSTAALPTGAYAFDIKFSNGVRVARTMTGTIILEPEVTP